jgi:NAD(P)-dependent dehydrogenase (short-subunit alcohol dehydrogenase family)
MAVQFRGASAIVTGGASGIGRSIVHALVTRGVRVVIADIDANGAEAEASALRAQGHEVTWQAVNVADFDGVNRLVDDVESRWGQVDFLFNNAGVVYIGDLLDMPHEAWKRTMDVNLWGVINGVRAAYPRMVRRGSGCIVNTASIAGLSPSPGFAIYSTSKHAVVGLSQALRGEAKKYGVQVNVLCPGVVSTPMVTNAHFSGIDGSGATAELRDRTPFAEPDRRGGAGGADGGGQRPHGCAGSGSGRRHDRGADP